MSECVVRMEMPGDCRTCPFSTNCSFCEGYSDYCVLAPDGTKCGWSFMDGEFPTERPSWCPIICSLPEGHGRLGDLDALADDVRSLWDYKTVDGITATTVLNQTLTDIRNCPTIVPAERSET